MAMGSSILAGLALRHEFHIHTTLLGYGSIDIQSSFRCSLCVTAPPHRLINQTRSVPLWNDLHCSLQVSEQLKPLPLSRPPPNLAIKTVESYDPLLLQANSESGLGSADTNLDSNLSQQMWVAFGCSVLGAMAMKTATELNSVEAVMAASFSIIAAYCLADLGTGIYHWAIDNYGDARSILFGSQIDAFQGHHKRPWTIAKRQFANNLHSLARPAGFALLPVVLAPGNVSLDAFVTVFMACIVFSQQFHAWAHMKKSQLPRLVRVLQDLRLLISPKMHGRHHRHPFNNNYCIVSGLWNPMLDRIHFFQKLELMIYQRSGIVPRSWEEATPQLQEVSYFEDEAASAANNRVTTALHQNSNQLLGLEVIKES